MFLALQKGRMVNIVPQRIPHQNLQPPPPLNAIWKTLSSVINDEERNKIH